MTDNAMWNPSGKYTALYLQEYGAGFPLRKAEAETDLDAPSGGETGYTSEWSNGKYMRRRKSGNPSDRTFSVNTRMRLTRDALMKLAIKSTKRTNLSNVYAFGSVSNGDPTTFKRAIVEVDTSFSLPSADKAILADTTGDETTPMASFSGTAGTEENLYQLVHVQSTVTTVNAAINHIICINDEEEEFLMVGDAVGPATTPRLYYYKLETDGTKTFKTLILNTVTNGVAARVTIMGDRVLIGVTGTSAGVWATSLATIKSTASGSNLSATQVSSTVITTAVNDVKAVGKYIFAVSTLGKIYISSDGGYSFSLLGTLSGTPTVNCIAGYTDKDVWFGAASGTVGNWYLEKTLTTYTPSAITGDSVTAIAVPPRETTIGGSVYRWVYIGTNTGEIWYAKDGGVSGTWTRSYFKDDGSGTISAIEFTGDKGICMSIIHTSASPASRVLVDYSGGAGGFTVREVSASTAFSNAGFNSIAWFDPNFALVGGEPISSLGFVGEVVGAS